CANSLPTNDCLGNAIGRPGESEPLPATPECKTITTKGQIGRTKMGYRNTQNSTGLEQFGPQNQMAAARADPMRPGATLATRKSCRKVQSRDGNAGP
uniref:Uncharacterized protein n=1 Tax=Romanomermis culicivorax TaxID=13658 RepID=A0A915JUE6_ROMCU